MSGSKNKSNIRTKIARIERRRKQEIVILIGIILGLLLIGTGAFHLVESWSILDALYFTTSTLTTVGFGDITPVTAAGKILTILYSWIGVTVAAGAIGIIGSIVLHEKIHTTIHGHTDDTRA